MVIRKARTADIDKIIELGKSVKEFHVSNEVVNFWPKHILLKCISSKNIRIFVAEEKQFIIGFIIANYNLDLKKVIVENIFVSHKYRGKNVGRKLLENLVKDLRSVGCEYMVSLVDVSDSKAIKFYRKHGFNKGINCVWLDKILGKSFKKIN